MSDSSNYNVAQLKELIRKKDLLTSGIKNDLILRLQENCPGIQDEIRQGISTEELREIVDDISSLADVNYNA